MSKDKSFIIGSSKDLYKLENVFSAEDEKTHRSLCQKQYPSYSKSRQFVCNWKMWHVRLTRFDIPFRRARVDGGHKKRQQNRFDFYGPDS